MLILHGLTIFKASKAFAGVLSPSGLTKKRKSHRWAIDFQTNSMLLTYINNKKETTGNWTSDTVFQLVIYFAHFVLYVIRNKNSYIIGLYSHTSALLQQHFLVKIAILNWNMHYMQREKNYGLMSIEDNYLWVHSYGTSRD